MSYDLQFVGSRSSHLYIHLLPFGFCREHFRIENHDWHWRRPEILLAGGARHFQVVFVGEQGSLSWTLRRRVAWSYKVSVWYILYSAETVWKVSGMQTVSFIPSLDFWTAWGAFLDSSPRMLSTRSTSWWPSWMVRTVLSMSLSSQWSSMSWRTT